MNYIDLALIAVIMAFCAVGIKRGFILSMLHFGSSVVAGILSKVLSNPIAEYIYGSYLQQPVIKKLYNVLPSGSVNGELQGVIDKVLSKFPEFIVNSAKQFNIYPDLTTMNTGTSNFTVEYIENDILRPIISKIVAMILVVILFVVFVFILRFVCHFINKLLTNKKKHKLINKTNKLLGGVFGAFKGVIPAGLATVVINLVASYSDNTDFLAAASESVICSFVSDLLH